MGFRSNRSTIDNIFIIRQIFEKSHEYNIDLYNIFVDYTHAFDSVYMTAIPKLTSNWLVKKMQNGEQNFIIWNIYIHNCIASPHSCHSHLGTCRTVTLVFVVPRQRTVQPSYAASC